MTDKQQPAVPVLTDVYGVRNVPDAAKFGVGASDRAQIDQATQARRDAQPGDYSKR